MLALIIPVVLIISGVVPFYQYEAMTNHIAPPIPVIPNVIGGIINSQNTGSVSKITDNPYYQTHSDTVTQTTIPIKTSPGIYQEHDPATGKVIENPVSVQSQQANVTTIKPYTYSTILLCGHDQIEYSYDKTDMRTGGDIGSFTAVAPSETMTINLSNGTELGTIKNVNINGCISKIIPDDQHFVLNISGDFNGIINSQSLESDSIVINCTPKWEQTVMYDNFGNIIAKYNPSIIHEAMCKQG